MEDKKGKKKENSTHNKPKDIKKNWNKKNENTIKQFDNKKESQGKERKNST